MSIDRWNNRYATGDVGPEQPSSIVMEISGRLSPGRALDLACGAGRNAVYLASKGWSVVAVDGSDAALNIVRQRDPRIETSRIDLEREALPFADESFDLVCIIHFLHRPLFAEAARVLKKGGFAVASIETTRSSMNRAYVVEPGELRTFFAGWEIVIDRDETTAQIAARKSM